MPTKTESPTGDASWPDGFIFALARLLASLVFSLPRIQALVLLENLERAAAASGSRQGERLLAVLRTAGTRVRLEPPVLRVFRHLLPVYSRELHDGLQEALTEWLKGLSREQFGELLPMLASSVHPRISDADVDPERRDYVRTLREAVDRGDAQLTAIYADLAIRDEESRDLRAAARELKRRNRDLQKEVKAFREMLDEAHYEQSRLRKDYDHLVRQLEKTSAKLVRSDEKSAEPETGPPSETLPREELQIGGTEPSASAGARFPDKMAAAEPQPPGQPPERHVETGFTWQHDPGASIDPGTSLVAGQRYWYWLEITEKELAGSIETARPALPPEVLKAGSRLTVVLFAHPGGMLLDEAARTGEMEVAADGSVGVARQPSPWSGEDAAMSGDVLDRRLLFPVTTPAAPGTATFRCNLYHGQTLVQSRLVRALVTERGAASDDALVSTLDYVLCHTLPPGYLESLPGHRLSLMVNRNDDGTHGFFFKGEKEFTGTASIAETEVQAQIQVSRKRMRKAAWGNEEEWKKDGGYRYDDGALDLGRLRDDLLTLAIGGLRLYRASVNQLAEGPDRALELRELMRTPGQVQIAHKVSPSFLLPASVFYDHTGLWTGAPLSATFELCPEFVRALGDDGTPLEQQPCFQGNCPSRDEKLVVCPSGFWGFRHDLGMPVTIGDDAPPAPVAIPVRNAAFGMAVFRDFQRRATHEQALQKLAAGWGWNYADTVTETLELLEKKPSQIVYFYCHGGYTNDAPYLMVGAADEGLIHPETLRMDLRWKEPQPLVFINGCETVAVAPEQAFQFVRSLVETHNAAGVIGTEITVFEPLAAAFAEEFFDRFLVKRRPLGESVRGARLALLKKGNPLGLVYVPFALAGLHLEPSA